MLGLRVDASPDDLALLLPSMSEIALTTVEFGAHPCGTVPHVACPCYHLARLCLLFFGIAQPLSTFCREDYTELFI